METNVRRGAVLNSIGHLLLLNKNGLELCYCFSGIEFVECHLRSSLLSKNVVKKTILTDFILISSDFNLLRSVIDYRSFFLFHLNHF